MRVPDARRPAARTGPPARALRALAAAAALLAAPAAAQQPASGEAALSPECRVPTGQLYTVAPLPAVRAALKAGRPLKVLAVGGSAAPGASASYPVKLEAALEANLPKADVLIEHRGLPGEIASGAAERLHSLVADVEPDLVVWQVGTHDAMARVDPDAFAAALDEAVAWLKSHGIDVVLVDPLYTASVAGDADYNRIVAVVREVAARERVPLVQRFEALRYLAGRSGGADGHMLGRQFRLNDLGLRCMAEHVALTVATALQAEPAGPAKADPSRPDPGKADPGKADPGKADPALTAPQRAPG
ncbi:GDSL-type esterase/lipase family protein [Methylobacterium sp. NEAU 140]|uniref:SGNH/GDSL hydrolase family protein n=1 Tax=Methylobacterium sp. NEAU 140 TaxID=3064945 RepID=UPI002733220C|nr:GDSL-type esterase/lipase family protein [Methylobacterium sp. NEAU 140]MDP4022822.1 GDSL-type esterase/lipase family protein [Methylobacterium sp. NEAU 140]